MSSILSVTIMIPLNKIDEVNQYLESQGYGPNNVTRKTVDGIGYILTIDADSGLQSAIKYIIGSIKSRSKVGDFVTEIMLESKSHKKKSGRSKKLREKRMVDKIKKRAVHKKKRTKKKKTVKKKTTKKGV